jgi:tetratricopeptide (TPR) repeat protein
MVGDGATFEVAAPRNCSNGTTTSSSCAFYGRQNDVLALQTVLSRCYKECCSGCGNTTLPHVENACKGEAQSTDTETSGNAKIGPRRPLQVVAVTGPPGVGKRTLIYRTVPALVETTWGGVFLPVHGCGARQGHDRIECDATAAATSPCSKDAFLLNRLPLALQEWLHRIDQRDTRKIITGQEESSKDVTVCSWKEHFVTHLARVEPTQRESIFHLFGTLKQWWHETNKSTVIDSRDPQSLESEFLVPPFPTVNAPSATATRPIHAAVVAEVARILSLKGPLVLYLEHCHLPIQSMDISWLCSPEDDAASSSTGTAGRGGLIVIASTMDHNLLDSGPSTTLRTPTDSVVAHQLRVANLTWDDLFRWTVHEFEVSIGHSNGKLHDCYPSRQSNELDATFQTFTDLLWDYSQGNPRHVKYMWIFLRQHWKKQQGDDRIPSTWSDQSLDALQDQIPRDLDDLYHSILQHQDDSVQSLVRMVAALDKSMYHGIALCGGWDATVLQWILPRTSLETLSQALDCGLLEATSNLSGGHQQVRFPCPAWQQLVYDSMSESSRVSLHCKIGRRLWKHSNSNIEKATPEMESLFYVMAHQLQLGASIISEDDERRIVATVHLQAGKQMMQASSFDLATDYFEFALSVIGSTDPWDPQWYDLSLVLHNGAAEAYYCIGNFDRTDQLLALVLDHATSFDDKLQAYTTAVYTKGARHCLQEALDTAFEVLRELEEPIPSNPSSLHVLFALWKTRRMLRGKSDRFFRNLPAATNVRKIATMQMLNFAFTYSYAVNQNRAALAVFRLLELVLEHGMTGAAVTAFSSYGLMLCIGLGSIREGVRYGNLALDLLHQFDCQAWLPRVYMPVYGYIRTWVNPLRDSIQPLEIAHHSALATGDIEGAGLSCGMYLMLRFHVGTALDQLEREARYYCDRFDSLGQTLGLLLILPQWETCRDLQGNDPAADTPISLTGPVTCRTAALNYSIKDENHTATALWYADRAVYYCLVGMYEESLSMAKLSRKAASDPHIGVLFYEALASLAVARVCGRHSVRRCRFIRLGRGAARCMQKMARTCAANFANKCYLLQAELAALHGTSVRAMSLFDSAIQAANREGFLQEEGLAYERLARYHCFLGHAYTAAPYFERARDAYRKWGAQTLVRRMQALLDTTCSVTL